jgi:hypothetical protein
MSLQLIPLLYVRLQSPNRPTFRADIPASLFSTMDIDGGVICAT